MESISGYARGMAGFRVKQQEVKPFLGKPYVRYGACEALWAYIFQLGGILGGKHSAELDAFAPAFLGAKGEPGSVKRFFTQLAKERVRAVADSSRTFFDYVRSEYMRSVGDAGDANAFSLKHMMQKIKPEDAVELAWQYASDGAALGALYPDIVRGMYERTHALRPESEWKQALAAGLDIPPEQDVITYEDLEEGEEEVFKAYCLEFCPNLCSVLFPS